MKSPEKSRKAKTLDLERDLLLTEEDHRYMQEANFEKGERVDFGDYLDFLEEIGAFNTKKIQIKAYPCNFEL